MDSKKAEGNALFQQGEAKAQEAYDKYTECLALDPSNTAYAAVILGNRAAASMKLKQWDKAIEDCDLSLQYKPDNVKALLRRAACRKEKGELEESVRDIEAALKLDSDSDDLKRQLRDAKMELKKKKRKVRARLSQHSAALLSKRRTAADTDLSLSSSRVVFRTTTRSSVWIAAASARAS